VLSGLNEGERVIVGNLGAYHKGQHVDPMPSPMADEGYKPDQEAQ
jgi:hypothetical protein